MKTKIAILLTVILFLFMGFTGCVTKDEPVLHPRLFMPSIKSTSLVDSTLTISWNASTNAVGYRIDVAFDSQFNPVISTATIDAASVDGLTYTFTDLPLSSTYFYRLIALESDEQYNSKPVIGSKP